MKAEACVNRGNLQTWHHLVIITKILFPALLALAAGTLKDPIPGSAAPGLLPEYSHPLQLLHGGPHLSQPQVFRQRGRWWASPADLSCCELLSFFQWLLWQSKLSLISMVYPELLCLMIKEDFPYVLTNTVFLTDSLLMHVFLKSTLCFSCKNLMDANCRAKWFG